MLFYVQIFISIKTIKNNKVYSISNPIFHYFNPKLNGVGSASVHPNAPKTKDSTLTSVVFDYLYTTIFPNLAQRSAVKQLKSENYKFIINVEHVE